MQIPVLAFFNGFQIDLYSTWRDFIDTQQVIEKANKWEIFSHDIF
jgi:hypothetical protein